RRGDRLVGDMLDQVIRRAPGLLRGLANDHMKTDAERQISAALAGSSLHAVDFVRDLRRWFTPGQIFINAVDGDIDAGIRRPTEIQRRSRRLNRLEQKPPVLDADMLSLEVDGLAGEKVAVDAEK